jgi:hypothetical protein
VAQHAVALVIVGQQHLQPHLLDAGQVFVVGHIARLQQVEGHHSPRLGQIAPGHQPVAAVVARPHQHQHLPLGHVVALLHRLGHQAPGALHHLRVSVPGRVGRLLRGNHLGHGVDLDRHGEKVWSVSQWLVVSG